MLLLVGEITATAGSVRLVAEATTAELVLDGDVINTAGESVAVETTVAEDDELKPEVTEIEDAVLEDVVVLEEAVVLKKETVLE